MPAINLEIAIQREDHTRGELFAHPYQAGIGQGDLHRGVTLQEPTQCRGLLLDPEGGNHETALDQVENSPLSASDLLQQKAGFGEHGVAGQKRRLNLS